jgi:branched-chain amino acid aminotransferase
MAKPFLTSVDGAISEPGEATISIADNGLVRGDGVFEMLRVYDGEPFAQDEHLDRLERSAAGVELPLDRALIEQEAAALLTAAKGADCNLRILLTRGGRRLMMLEAPLVHPETVTLASVSFTPNLVLAGVKSLSYCANEQATRVAAAQGADEALLIHPDDKVLEAPTSSIFWASAEGRLRTPALELGILDSITRAFLVRELSVEEGNWPASELTGAREAFLASTTREVQAVAAIDGQELPEAPGALTREAQDAYGRLTGEARSS